MIYCLQFYGNQIQVWKKKSKVPNRLLNPLLICACCTVACCSAAAWCNYSKHCSNYEQTLAKIKSSYILNKLLNPLIICSCCAGACCSASGWCKCGPLFSWQPILWPSDFCLNFHVGTEDCQRSLTLGQTNINKQCIIQLKSTVPKSVKRLLNPLFIRACCATACCSAAAWCKCVPPFSWRPAATMAAASIAAALAPRGAA